MLAELRTDAGQQNRELEGLRHIIIRAGIQTKDRVGIGDALSEGGPLAVGAEVEAVRVEGRGLLVRPRAVRPQPAEPPAVDPRRAAAGTSSPEQPAQTGPLLSKTLEEFDFEQLEPPSA